MGKAKKTSKVEEPEVLGKLSDKQRNKILQASSKATIEMAEYLKKHKLDPDKDWKEHPIHGPKIKEWVKIIRKAERTAIHHAELRKEKTLVKPKLHIKVRTVTKAPNIYDYPDVEGKPMPRGMRKKYRSRMRALIKANMPREEAEKRALQIALTWIPEEDPLEHRRSKVVDPEFEEITPTKRKVSEEPKRELTKKEKRSRKFRKEMAQKINQRKSIKVSEDED